jgi:hypothetical protein
MATIEDLLGLGPEGIDKLSAMTDAELAEYFKDIQQFEPPPIDPAQLCGSGEDEDSINEIKLNKKKSVKKIKKDEQIDELQGELSDDNPMKKGKSIAKKQKSLFDDIDKMIMDIEQENN